MLDKNFARVNSFRNRSSVILVTGEKENEFYSFNFFVLILIGMVLGNIQPMLSWAGSLF